MKLIKRVGGRERKERRRRKKEGKEESGKRTKVERERERREMGEIEAIGNARVAPEPTGRNSPEWQFLLAHTERVVAFYGGSFAFWSVSPGRKTRRISVGIYEDGDRFPRERKREKPGTRARIDETSD